MVSEVVRANFGSYSAPALGGASGVALGRPGSSAQRFAPANDSPLLDHDLIDANQSEGGRRPRAWGAQVRSGTVTLEDLLPRATFAAQLMSQENGGVRAHIEDFASVVSAYTTAEQRPSRAAVGSNLTIEM
jgi:hypothetical protein